MAHPGDQVEQSSTGPQRLQAAPASDSDPLKLADHDALSDTKTEEHRSRFESLRLQTAVPNRVAG